MSSSDLTEADEPRRKVLKTFKGANIDKLYTTHTFKSNFAAAYVSKSRSSDDHTGAEVLAEPFRHVSLPRFLDDAGYIENLITELQSLDMQEKNNDLYKFKQSIELKHVNSPCIKAFRNVLHDEMLPWLRDVTGSPLNDKVDMFCSIYEYTDTLLCHDDELEERHIAFIYYLVPESWSKEDGGTLDLFDADDKGQPSSVVKSIVPAQNHFVFFEVSAASFHQVAEVLAEKKTRLAISGWFHGPPITRPPPYVEPAVPIFPCGGIGVTGTPSLALLHPAAKLCHDWLHH